MIRQKIIFLLIILNGQVYAQGKIKYGTFNVTNYSCGFTVNIWEQHRLTINKDSTFDYELLTYTSPVKPKRGYKKPSLENYKCSFGKWTTKGDTLLLKPAYDDDLFDYDLLFADKNLYQVSVHKKIPFHKELFPSIKKKIKRRQWQRSDNIGRHVIRT